MSRSLRAALFYRHGDDARPELPIPKPMQWVWFILIGLIAGWLAGLMTKGGGFGLLGNLIVGVIGALLGGFLFGVLGFSESGGLIGQLAIATAGAVVLLFLIGVISKK